MDVYLHPSEVAARKVSDLLFWEDIAGSSFSCFKGHEDSMPCSSVPPPLEIQVCWIQFKLQTVSAQKHPKTTQATRVLVSFLLGRRFSVLTPWGAVRGTRLRHGRLAPTKESWELGSLASTNRLCEFGSLASTNDLWKFVTSTVRVYKKEM